MSDEGEFFIAIEDVDDNLPQFTVRLHLPRCSYSLPAL